MKSKLLSKIAFLAVVMATAFAGNAWAAENDTHDFSQSLSQLLNNNASISSINIASQSYPVKKVIVSYRYNKTIPNAVTVAVSVGGTSWGSQHVNGTGSNFSTLEFTGNAVTGAIEISFTNNTGNGTGHGTFYVNNVQLVEGAAGGSSDACATPSFLPAAGKFVWSKSVEISTSTEGATLYYTTDGTDPTSSSNEYASAINLTATTTIKAIAVKEGLKNSEVASATYTKVVTNHAGTQADPYSIADARTVIDENVGLTNVYVSGVVSQVDSYNSTYKSITYWISDDGTTTNQLEVYSGKDLNGGDFNSVDDIVVGDVVTVKGTLKKYNTTYEFDYNNQLVSHVSKPATPSFSPVAGAVEAGTEVTISTTTDGAIIYYTTDGTDPTTSSSLYSVAITVNAAMTIKAIAVKDEKSSDIATAVYTIAEPVATPTFSPAAGIYNKAQNVTISCETEGATIYYTIDGTDPTTSSDEYTSAINVTETITIKAIAAKSGMANSEVASATYTMEIPTITFDSGNSLQVEASATEASVAFTASFTSGTISAVTCDSEGNAQDYEWFDADVNENNVELVFDANTSTTDARTAYFKLTASNATSPVFTLTQKKFVVDYASLPFEFDNGISSIESTTGLSQSGLGSDYSSSPKLKFDHTGDFVILKINEDPGTLAFKIKGNSFSGGTFKVQTSADGSNYSDLASYTSLGDTQSESFDNLASTVRYIKWIYTEKSSGNVALGKISLAKSVASITPASTTIEATSAETDGTLNVTYKKIESDPEIQWFESDGETTATKPSWVETDFDASNNVEYLIAANTGNERSAYFKVYGLDGSAEDVYSSLITITQEAYVEVPIVPAGDNYTLFSGDLVEGDYIIYYDGYAMKNTVESDRLQYVEVTPSGEVIRTDNPAIVWHIAQNGSYWTIYSADANAYAASTGAKNKAQILADRTDDKALWSVEKDNGVFEFTNKQNTTNNVNSTLRYNSSYGFACYSTSTGGALSLYKLDAPAVAESINATLYNGLYWATFYSGVARYKLPDGTRAYTMNSSKQLFLLGTDGSVIPAGTAVIIISDTATPALTQIPNTGDVTVYGGGENILRGSNAAVAVSGITGTPYVMGIVGSTLGFYEYDGDEIPAGKAYYVVTE